MPKKVHEINPFHGGINNKDDQRDIADSQLVEALNVKADSRGTLKLIGNLVEYSQDWASAADGTTHVYPGYGFFRFSSDANAAGSSGADQYNTNYLIAWSEEDHSFYWYYGTTWAKIIDLERAANSTLGWGRVSAAGGRKPTFSYANGALRICDANFNNLTNVNRWLGYIKRHNFKGSNAAENLASWKNIEASLDKPSDVLGGSGNQSVQTTLLAANVSTEQIKWVVSDCRLNTTAIHAYSFQDNAANWITTPSSGDNQYVIHNTTFEHPYDGANRTADLAYAVDLSGDNIFSGSGSIKIGTDPPGSISPQYFVNAFTFPTDSSLYLSVKLKNNDTFDAWNGGFAFSSETTVIFRNLKIKVFNHATGTTNYASWTIPASKISLNSTEWFVLELPHDEANENNLSGTSINAIEFSWDTTVQKSGSDSIDTTVYALSVSDARIGDKGQQGNDLTGNTKFGYSLTYDDKKSESLIEELDTINFGTNTSGYSKLFQAGVRSFVNKRITGGVLYAYRDDIPYMLSELDFVKGLRGSWETEWPGTNDSTSQWTDSGANSAKSNTTYSSAIPLIESYQARNGFNHKQDSINARYKSIVITNNRAYIGNVYIDGVSYPDKMIKSQAFDYDAFPEEGRSIEVVQQDGDSIVTLAAYADRLFQYKNNKVHVINITSEQEFLEDSHTGLGVSYPYHVVSMSSGIAWFNKNGAYYFDGKQINNITNGLIDDEDWDEHVTLAGNKAQIFYVPKQDKITIIGGANGANMYEYTIYTKGWTRGEALFDNTNYTNYILDVDNEVKTLKPENGKWSKWSDTATIPKVNYRVTTGDLIFDSSAVRKKIYSVHVTHKGLGSAKSIKCWGRPDRAGSWTDLGALDNYSDFTVQEFDVSGVNNARSYQVKLEWYDSDSGVAVSSIPVGFEVNDINIVYRSKNVR